MFFMFLNYFDVLISKIILKIQKKTYILLIYILIQKNYLKNKYSLEIEYTRCFPSDGSYTSTTCLQIRSNYGSWRIKSELLHYAQESKIIQSCTIFLLPTVLSVQPYSIFNYQIKLIVLEIIRSVLSYMISIYNIHIIIYNSQH